MFEAAVCCQVIIGSITQSLNQWTFKYRIRFPALPIYSLTLPIARVTIEAWPMGAVMVSSGSLRSLNLSDV